MEADGLESAQRMLRRRHIALAIVDVDAFEGVGPETLAQLREARPTVKLVIVAASLDQGAFLDYLAAGAFCWILEEDSGREVARRLESALQGELAIPRSLRAPRGGTPPQAPQAQSEDGNPGDPPEVLERLTERQPAVLRLLEEGMTNKQISRELSITTRTVKMNLSAIYRALGVANRTQALAALLKLRGR